MPTLFHAPLSRSTTIMALIEELGAAGRVQVVEVSVARSDGSGGADPRNPHPEGKVPFLVDGADHVRERGAITLYLTDLYPEVGLGRPVGHPQRGAYLSWLFYYQGVMEPVLVLDAAGLSHPVTTATFRDLGAVHDRLSEALEAGPYLLGRDYSAADLLLSSPFLMMPDALPDRPALRKWLERCGARPAVRAVMDREMPGA